MILKSGGFLSVAEPRVKQVLRCSGSLCVTYPEVQHMGKSFAL